MRGLGEAIGVASAFFAGGAGALGLAEAGLSNCLGGGGGGGGGGMLRSMSLSVLSTGAGVRRPDMPSSIAPSPMCTRTTASAGPARSRGERSPEYIAQATLRRSLGLRYNQAVVAAFIARTNSSILAGASGSVTSFTIAEPLMTPLAPAARAWRT